MNVNIGVSPNEAELDFGTSGAEGQTLTTKGTAGVALTASASVQDFPFVSEEGQDVSVGVSTSIVAGGGSYYTGEYEATPSAEAQTLATRGCIMTSNITVNPIPSNYGLIAWDGSSLSVS